MGKLLVMKWVIGLRDESTDPGYAVNGCWKLNWYILLILLHFVN